MAQTAECREAAELLVVSCRRGRGLRPPRFFTMSRFSRAQPEEPLVVHGIPCALKQHMQAPILKSSTLASASAQVIPKRRRGPRSVPS